MSSNYSVAALAPSGTHLPAGVTLDFPASVIGPPPAGEVPAEVIEEVVVMAARPAPQAAPVPAQAGPAAPQCVGDVTTALNAIVAAIPTVATGEQGQTLLAQANAVGAVANACLAEAQQIGFAGVGTVAQLVEQAGAAVAQIQALPVVASLTPEQLAEAPNLVGGIVGGVGQVVGGSLNLVGEGLGLLGTGLNYLTKPLQ